VYILHYDVAGRSLLTYKALCSYDVIGLVAQNTLWNQHTDESVFVCFVIFGPNFQSDSSSRLCLRGSLYLKSDGPELPRKRTREIHSPHTHTQTHPPTTLTDRQPPAGATAASSANDVDLCTVSLVPR